MYLLDKQVSCRVHKYIIQTSGWGENEQNNDIVFSGNRRQGEGGG